MNHPADPMSDGLAPAFPPPELRQRVLSAARDAMDGADTPDMWAQIWRSRNARLAWAVSIGTLIFGHLVIDGQVHTGPAEPAFPLAAAAGTNDELAEIVGLRRVTVDLPGWELKPRDVITPEDRSIGNEEPS